VSSSRVLGQLRVPWRQRRDGRLLGAFAPAADVREREQLAVEHRLEDLVAQLGLDGDVAVAVQQQDPHAPTRPISRS